MYDRPYPNGKRGFPVKYRYVRPAQHDLLFFLMNRQQTWGLAHVEIQHVELIDVTGIIYGDGQLAPAVCMSKDGIRYGLSTIHARVEGLREERKGGRSDL